MATLNSPKPSAAQHVGHRQAEVFTHRARVLYRHLVITSYSIHYTKLYETVQYTGAVSEDLRLSVTDMLGRELYVRDVKKFLGETEQLV